MPTTKYTEYVNHCFQLIQDVRKFADERVQPVINALRHDTSRTDVPRDVAIAFTFGRMHAWMHTFDHLNKTSDVQAVGAGARSMFEHALDLAWFKAFPDQKWVDCFWGFSDAHKYKQAQQAIKFKTENAGSKIQIAPYQQFIEECDKKEPMDQKIKRLWGRPPKNHWTGIRTLPERAKALGTKYLDEYYRFYPIFSALIHSGPALTGHDFERIELLVGLSYFHAFDHIHNSMLLTCELLGIENRVADLDRFLLNIAEWLDQAVAKYPNLVV